MESIIEYRDLSNGPVEACRELSNALFAHQAEQGVVHKEILAGMNFDSRLKRSFDNTKDKYLLVAYDGEEPIGYVFNVVEDIDEAGKNARPPWADSIEGENLLGFFPEEMSVPARIGTLNNIYLKPEYRGRGVGKVLMESGMDWFKNYSDLDYIFVNISNGNDVAKLYESYGFKYSHPVFGGFIEAYSIEL